MSAAEPLLATMARCPVESSSTPSSPGPRSPKERTTSRRNQRSCPSMRANTRCVRDGSGSWFGAADSAALPNTSIQVTSQESPPSCTSSLGGSSRRRLSFEAGSPSSSSGVPFAREAAAGAKTSLPSKVGPPGRGSAAEITTTWLGPPEASRTGQSRPLSGPTKTRSGRFDGVTATGLLGPPTPGSTTARRTPEASQGRLRRRSREPATTSWRGIM